jgi:ribose 5-phosphate isomerase A
MSTNPQPLRAIAERALELIPDGGVIGLGTGRAATAFIHALGERVRAGLRVRAVPTSQASADLARQLGIPLVTFEEVDALDVDVDGADEVDPRNNLIKGYGGALVREKIVAAAARRLVILVGPEKLVPVLGSRGNLPVEVVPFGLAPCRRRLTALGCVPQLRREEDRPFVTDNGNYILDCRIPPLERPGEWEQALRAVPGVVGTGLFLDMDPTVLIQDGDAVQVRQPARF